MKINMKLPFVVLLLFWVAELKAQTFLDSLFQKWNGQTPGVVVAIKHRDSTQIKSYGLANLAAKTKNTPQTKFNACSMSKHITCMCLWILEDRGLLSIEDDIRKYLPEMKPYDKPVQIKHCLYGTSGLREFIDLLDLTEKNENKYWSNSYVYDLACKQQFLEFTPGAAYIHNNTNYSIITEIVERVSGKPLWKFAEEEIFKPLGMNNTYFKWRDTVDALRSIGYETTKGKYRTAHWISTDNLYGPKNLYTTPNDLLLWLSNFSDNKLNKASKTLIEKFCRTGELNDGYKMTYASAFFYEPYAGKPSVMVNGGGGGYTCQMLNMPESKLSIVVMANHEELDAYNIVYRIAEKMIPLTEAKTQSYEANSPTYSNDSLKQLEGFYFDTIARNLNIVLYRNSQLFLNSWRFGKSFKAIPLSSRSFLVKQPDYKYTLNNGTLDESRKGDRISGKRYYNRLDTVKMSAESKRALAGFYKSPEYGVTFEIRYKKGELTLVKGKDKAVLHNLFKDGFVIGDDRATLMKSATDPYIHIQYGSLVNLQFSKVK